MRSLFDKTFVRYILYGFFCTFSFLMIGTWNTNSTGAQESCDLSQISQELEQEDFNNKALESIILCSESAKHFADLLNSAQSPVIKLNAAYALHLVDQSRIQTFVDELVVALDKNGQNPKVRYWVITAIGNSQSSDLAVADALIEVLEKDEVLENRAVAAWALGKTRAAPQKVLPALAKALKIQYGNEGYDIYVKCAEAIAAYGVASEPYLEDFTTLVQSSNYSPDARLVISDAVAKISLAMYEEVHDQASSPMKINQLRRVWQTSRQLRLLSRKLERTLQALESPDFATSYKEVERYKELVDGTQRDIVLSMARQSFSGVSQIAITHGVVWLALIFAYPRSPMVQTAFFWNPRIRRILGFPYVTGALKWVPYFRNILFIPFRDALRSDANLDLFKGQTYFSDLKVKAEGWSESVPINQVIPKLKGQIVLQGESGSGKSMFLRYLLSQSSRIAVYLPAQKCNQGVIAAIQAKLYGQAQDADFLRDLIYSGAIDIYIDGLNEVTPDTRAGIKEFVEKNFKGNIILTTQPLEWQPPGQIYNLQPLNIGQISDFLQQQPAAEPAAYSQACSDYLRRVEAELAAETVPVDEKVALRQSLSNPMDLTVVAQLIASQKRPNLLRLREQQYTTMTEDYQRIYLGRSFPLEAFSEMAYRLRLESQAQISEADFGDELLCLERHKMVVRRQRSGEGGAGLTQWFFRHEKVADFFVAQAFLQATDDRQTQHFADSRFRGVYLLLATLLPEPQKMALREQLIQYAARHNDHLLSDAFIRRVGSPEIKLV